MSDKELFEKLNRRMDFLKTEIIYTGKQSSDNYYYKEFKLNTYCALAYNKTSKVNMECYGIQTIKGE